MILVAALVMLAGFALWGTLIAVGIVYSAEYIRDTFGCSRDN
jgi:hypothetical protein